MRRPSSERPALFGLGSQLSKARHRRRSPLRRPGQLTGLESLEPRRVLTVLPIISEVLASNDRVIDDVDGDDSDYIELYNAGDEDMSLNRYYLTDNPGDLQKWRLPDVMLPAGEYLVVFASNKDRNDPGQELHTNFRVSASGEYLALVEPDGQTVAFAYSPGIPSQVTDVSYGVPTGMKDSTLIGRGSAARVLVPTDGSLDPIEGEGLDGTWLSPSYDDSDTAWMDATVGLGFVPSDAPTEVANSVTDFSGVQGQDGWEYGAWYKSIDTDGIYEATEFKAAVSRSFLPELGIWDFGPGGSSPNTELTADGGQPSAGFLTQWAVRRWVSEAEGEITISGTLGNEDSSGDGIVGRILVNGNEVFQRAVNGTSGEYSVTTTVALGDAIDFAIDGGIADDDTGDRSTFTASIQGVAQRVIPAVPMTDSSADWNRTGEQGVDNWFYGYYQQSDDPDQTYAAKDFEAFGPGYWDRNTWRYPGNTIETKINRSSMAPHAANGIVQWVMRRWDSPVDGTLVVDYDVSMLRAGGDGSTLRVFHNGVPVDMVQVDGDDTTAETREVTITGVKRGDHLDFAVDPLGPGVDPLQPNGELDQTNIDIRITRLADIAEQIDTDLGDAIRGMGSSFYVRIPFTVDDVGSLDQITLNMMYDDGYVAYINGQLIASAGAPDELSFASASTQQRLAEEATLFESIDISDRRGLFVEGENVLQVHLLNARATDDEILLVPELVIGTLSADLGQTRYFSVPTPGSANGLGAARVGPLIVDSSHSPNTPLQTEPIVVTAVVSETFGAVADVTLTYRVMYGETVTVPMLDDGQGSDEQAADGVYTGTIPAGIAEPGEMIRWNMIARDSDGMRGRSPAQNDPSRDEEYHGTIVADPTVQSSLPVFHWFLEFPDKTISAVKTPGSVFYDGEFYDNVNFTVHGQSSSGFPTKKRSLNVDFPNDHRLRLNDDLPRLEDINWLTNFADRTKMRNTLAYEERAASGGAYHLAFPIRVQQNGDFFAVYDFVEDPDERWLARLGYDEPGAVYKMYNNFGAAQAEKKTRTEEDNSDLKAFIDGILKDDAPNVDFLMDNVNMAQMANFLAGFAITSNHDCCHKNYYAYHDIETTGEWWFLPWDVDLSYGHRYGGFGLGYFDDTIYPDNGIRTANATGNNQLTGRLFESVPGFDEMFLRRLRTLMDERIKPPGTPVEELPLETRIAELYELLKPDADLDNETHPATWGQGGFQTFDESMKRLLDEFVTPRREFLYSQPEVPPAQIGNPQLDFGVIEFNPASGNQLEEYIQLVNNNDVAVDISGWQLGGDVEWTFDPGTVLPAGFTLYASPDARAFRARATGPTGGMGLFVQGNYEGRLPNVGGTRAVDCRRRANRKRGQLRRQREQFAAKPADQRSDVQPAARECGRAGPGQLTDLRGFRVHRTCECFRFRNARPRRSSFHQRYRVRFRQLDDDSTGTRTADGHRQQRGGLQDSLR